MRLREPAAVVVLVGVGLQLVPIVLVVAMSSGAPVEVRPGCPWRTTSPTRRCWCCSPHCWSPLLGRRAHPARPRLDPRPRLVLTAGCWRPSWAGRRRSGRGLRPEGGNAPLSGPHSCRRSPRQWSPRRPDRPGAAAGAAAGHRRQRPSWRPPSPNRSRSTRSSSPPGPRTRRSVRYGGGPGTLRRRRRRRAGTAPVRARADGDPIPARTASPSRHAGPGSNRPAQYQVFA